MFYIPNKTKSIHIVVIENDIMSKYQVADKWHKFWHSWEIVLWFPTSAQKLYCSTSNISHTPMCFWKHLPKNFQQIIFYKNSLIEYLLFIANTERRVLDACGYFCDSRPWTELVVIVKLTTALRRMMLIGMWPTCVRLAHRHK